MVCSEFGPASGMRHITEVLLVLSCGYLKTHSNLTKTYSRYSMFVNSIYVWNQLRANKLKEVLITFFINWYN